MPLSISSVAISREPCGWDAWSGGGGGSRERETFVTFAKAPVGGEDRKEKVRLDAWKNERVNQVE